MTMTMTKIEDRIDDDPVKWYAAVLDTPMHFSSEGCRTPEEAMQIPGCAVKSRERDDVWPKHFGKVVSVNMTTGRVVVRGHGSPVSPCFVWEGTVEEYETLWECD